jgi:trehalose synthase
MSLRPVWRTVESSDAFRAMTSALYNRTSSTTRARWAEVPLAQRPLELLYDEVDSSAAARLRAARDQMLRELDGRVMWNVNSAALGGGVAEMLRTTLPYWRGIGVDARWLVTGGGPAFFELTKRLHNMLHCEGHQLNAVDHGVFDRGGRAAEAGLKSLVKPGDLVILHDPQTAVLIPPVKALGATVIWRCHVGADRPSESVAEAWGLLLPYVERADLQVFTRDAYVPEGLDRDRVLIFPPAIDPCSPKNQPLADGVAEAILGHCGLFPVDRRAVRRGAVRVPLRWGGEELVRRSCRLLQGSQERQGRQKLVLALSRWDRLKDPTGVMRGFAWHVADPNARLILAGPEPRAVADDPEGLATLRAVQKAWRALRPSERRRIDVAVLPMARFEENALIVNALQREAAVVVKKSIQEGFGLGVTEALWKARPVVATRVGGQRDQIVSGETGLLVDDPMDLAAFGGAVDRALAEAPFALERLGNAGRERVRARYLADSHFVHWAEAIRVAHGR